MLNIAFHPNYVNKVNKNQRKKKINYIYLICNATVWPEEGHRDLREVSPSVKVRSRIKPDPVNSAVLRSVQEVGHQI